MIPTGDIGEGEGSGRLNIQILGGPRRLGASERGKETEADSRSIETGRCETANLNKSKAALAALGVLGGNNFHE